MEQKKIPGVVWRRVIFSLLMGVTCIAVGVAACLSTRDTPFLLLSLSVTAGCFFRAITTWKCAAAGKMNILEGTCIDCSRTFHRFQEVLIEDDAGEQTVLKLQKNLHIKSGKKYRFYFKESGRLRIGQAYLDALFSAGDFFGIELVR